jgi:outer membrane protein OmpA-like peptidoglycan-associated protein
MQYQKLKFTLALLLSVLANCAIAEEKAQMLDNDSSFCKIFKIFNGNDMPRECIKTRGPIVPPSPIAFMINFEFDSANILPKSTIVLDTLLAVIQDKKMDKKIIRIEGHTDKVGTAEYNQQLSEQRALAVKRYLTERGVEKWRVQTEGFGFKNLYDPEHPEDEANRRVEFINLGKQE